MNFAVKGRGYTLLPILILSLLILPSPASASNSFMKSINFVAEAEPQTAPDFTLRAFDGTYTSLSQFRGKIVFLNFWTTWCPPCRIEMPAMEELHKKMKDKDLVVLAVSLDKEGFPAVAQFMEDKKYTFSILLDSTNKVGAMFRVKGIPTTFIIDRNMRIIGKTIGPKEWDGRKSINFFSDLLDNNLPFTASIK